MTTVLITGATGEVARGTIPMLEQHFDLRLLSLDPMDDPRGAQADLLDIATLEPCLADVDAILHLAIATGHNGTFEEDGFNALRFDVNVKGTYHLLEAAKRAGVRRVVHISSLMVVWGYGESGTISGDAPPRPVGTYAITKMLGEQIAEQYAGLGLEVITLRIAAPLDIHNLTAPVRPQQVPFPDLAQAFVQALTVPLHGYEVVTIVGESSRRRWDLTKANQLLGYEPQINLDMLNIQWADPFDVR